MNRFEMSPFERRLQSYITETLCNKTPHNVQKQYLQLMRAALCWTILCMKKCNHVLSLSWKM